MGADAATWVASQLSSKTQAAWQAKAAIEDEDDGKPLSHKALQKVHDLVFGDTITHGAASKKMQELIAAHKHLYGGNEAPKVASK